MHGVLADLQLSVTGPQSATLTPGYAMQHVILLLMMLLGLQESEMGIFKGKLLHNIKEIAMEAQLMISVGSIQLRHLD